MTRETKITLLLVGLGIFILSYMATPAEPAEALQGQVEKVIDGDTIRVQGVKVRLNGVDAPEMDTAEGQAARDRMSAIVARTTLFCRLTGAVTYDRMVGTCYRADGADIAALLIADGFALDCPRYSKGAYAAAEPEGVRSHLRQSGYCELR